VDRSGAALVSPDGVERLEALRKRLLWRRDAARAFAV